LNLHVLLILKSLNISPNFVAVSLLVPPYVFLISNGVLTQKVANAELWILLDQ